MKNSHVCVLIIDEDGASAPLLTPVWLYREVMLYLAIIKDT